MRLAQLSLLTPLLLVTAYCSDDGDAQGNVCAPGIQIACACPGAGKGIQICYPDGTGYGLCKCSDAGGSAGNPGAGGSRGGTGGASSGGASGAASGGTSSAGSSGSAAGGSAGSGVDSSAGNGGTSSGGAATDASAGSGGGSSPTCSPWVNNCPSGQPETNCYLVNSRLLCKAPIYDAAPAAGAPCQYMEDCASSQICIYATADAGTGTCRWLCKVNNSAGAPDSGIVGGPPGQGGCATNQICVPVPVPNPSWLGFCNP